METSPKILLAKSIKNGREISLFAHSKAVYDAALILFGSENHTTSLGVSWLRFFKLHQSDFLRFIHNLKLATILHDLGKANDAFQEAIHHKSEQIIRHEHLSGLMLMEKPLRSWLTQSPGLDFEIVVSAIISHHLKADAETFGKRLIEGHRPPKMLLNSPEVKKCFNLAANILGQPGINLNNLVLDEDRIRQARGKFKQEAHQFKRTLKPDEKRILLATKAALIVADAAASAIMRENMSLELWLHQCFDTTPLSAEWLDEKIITPRIKEIEVRLKRPFRWLDFQNAAGNLGSRALLLSACGSGKTLAAWKWIQNQLNTYPIRRVIFLYPTRATATEGFRDYVSWAGDKVAALQHGTAEFDLDGMFGNPDPRQGEDYHIRQRLFALGYWPKRVFSATVDSFLAFIRNQYAAICMLPVLCESVVVIDEVHSFDRRMFTALEQFLKFFNLPVLCMTATLPDDRKRILTQDCGLDVFPKEKKGLYFQDLKLQTEMGRYNLSVIEDEDGAKKFVIDALKNKKKILWVVNTVTRCQETAMYFGKEFPDDLVLCYHSRFCLIHRKERHESVIHKFAEPDIPLLLVTTQVCEMSLDLDADVLITETVPVPSLIQRMGRCCRKKNPGDHRIGKVIVYPVPTDKPYDPEEMEQGKDFIDIMSKKTQPLSQQQLADYVQEMDIISPFPRDGYTGFLDAEMYAMGRDDPFRQIGDYTADCILDKDVAEFVKMRKNKNPKAVGFIVPVPRRFTSQNASLGKRLREAPSSHYSEKYGFYIKEQNDD